MTTELDESRRLTGPNIIWDRHGAVIDVALPKARVADAVALWRGQARRMLDAVGWPAEDIAVRRHANGAALALSAPLDALYAATEVNDWAWQATLALLDGGAEPALDGAAQELRRTIEAESNPALRAIAAAAAERGVCFLHGDDLCSVGLGAGSISWPEDDLPAADAIDWSKVHDVPVALVTGTNGKSTTVRLTAAIASAAGHTTGLCSSDWVRIGDDIVDSGDFTGPGGARQVLRDRRVDIAVIEVARGGLLRRGLAIGRADAALITNVAEDHLGEYGIDDLAALTDAKFVVARAALPNGRLILNADDPNLVTRGARHGGPIGWFGLTPEAARAAGDDAVTIDDGCFVIARDGATEPVLAVADFPPGLGGSARHNLANALASIALARSLDLPVAACAKGLARFTNSPRDNPGRANLFDLGGVSVMLDFAHNPHGMTALLETIQAMPAARRLLLLGQAGDRRDEDIRALTRSAAATRPDRVIVKEMAAMLRGRQPGEVPRMITAELGRLGVDPATISQAANETDAVRQALEWARPGDLLLLFIHVERDAVLALLETLGERGWQPGEPLK